MNKNTLVIALSSYAGMGPYVATIVNSFQPNDPIWFVLGEDDGHYYTKNIKPELLPKCRIVYRSNSALSKLCDLFFSDRILESKVKSFMNAKNIQAIHLLTGEFPLRGAIDKWGTRYQLYMTVHDLHPHEAHKAFYKMWRQRMIYKMLDKMMNNIPNLLTNSEPQYDELCELYPSKKIHYHDFPTLVTDKIKRGKDIVPELQNEKGYVLFFGRIEAYKGLHLLYESWCENAVLHDNYKLVIAGSGEVYFSRRENERNIIFVNRYIHDEEVASLYMNACCTVYPYVSASQSGVLSLSCWFQRPILASDVPFFRFVSDKGLGYTFTNGNKVELANNLIKLIQSNNEEMKMNEEKFYFSHYDGKSIRDSLLSIYTNEQ